MTPAQYGTHHSVASQQLFVELLDKPSYNAQQSQKASLFLYL